MHDIGHIDIVHEALRRRLARSIDGMRNAQRRGRKPFDLRRRLAACEFGARRREDLVALVAFAEVVGIDGENDRNAIEAVGRRAAVRHGEFDGLVFAIGRCDRGDRTDGPADGRDVIKGYRGKYGDENEKPDEKRLRLHSAAALVPPTLHLRSI